MSFTGIDIGAVTGSFNYSAGIYTVGCTGGGGIAGNDDGLYFVYESASGNNLELIAQIFSQTGTNAYATSGLMVSDLSSSYPAASQCAMIGVSSQNGVNFWCRTADNTVAVQNLGPSLAAPIWLRLVVSGSSVGGFYSTDGIQWQPAGECTMTLPASFGAGMTSYSNVGGATNTATIKNFYTLTNVPQRTTNLLPNWTETAVGTASGTFVANVDGSYTVSGVATGGLGGISDNYWYPNEPVTGNIVFTAEVSTISNTNPYAFGGIALSDLSTAYPLASQSIAIGVSYSEGVFYGYRTTDGATAVGANPSTDAPPLWFRLVVSQGLVTGLQSSDGLSFTPIIAVPMSFSGTFYAGFAVTSNSSTAAVVTYGAASAILSAYMLCWLRCDVNVTYGGTGSSVSLWQDQSGQGYNASQSNATNQPSLVTNAINALPAINLNGSTGFLQFPAAGFSEISSGLSIFIVLKPTAVTAGSQILNLGTGISNDYNIGLEINASSEAEYFVYTSTGATMTSVSLGSAMTTSAQLIEVVQSGTSASIYLRGGSVVTNNSMNAIPAPTNGRPNSYLGQGSGGGNYFNGEVAELLIYQTALSTAQRQAIETYLINKYNL